jgi:hypothetical protein
MVELEWKTSSLHNTPLAVELSWKDHSKTVKIWESSSKLIRSGVCRKKNLNPVTTYEFRIRAIEDLAGGKLGNKSEWTESLVVLLPPEGPMNPTPTPDETKNTKSTAPSNNVPKPEAKPHPPSRPPSTNRSNRSSRENLKTEDNKKSANTPAANNSNYANNSAANDKNNKNTSKPAAAQNNNDSDLNSPSKGKFRRFNSKFGIASTTDDVNPLTGGKNVHYMETDSPVEIKEKGNLSRLSNPPSYLSASAKLAWGKETLGREDSNVNNNNNGEKNNKNDSDKSSKAKKNPYDDDVTYLEVDEDLDASASPEDLKERKKNKPTKEEDSAGEVDDDESIKNKQHRGASYEDDFEIEESRKLHGKSGANEKDSPDRKLSFDAEEVEEEYTDSDVSSQQQQQQQQQQQRPPARASAARIIPEKRPKKSEGEKKSRHHHKHHKHHHHHHHHTNNNKSNKDDEYEDDYDDYEMDNNNEDDGDFELDEEKLFLLYPPHDDVLNKKMKKGGGGGGVDGSSENENDKNRIYRHPVHKEPFLKSEVKGYLLDDQNVIGCATCGDWLRVKIHVTAKNPKVAPVQEDWGWCLRKDKLHVYLKILEGKKNRKSSHQQQQQQQSQPSKQPSFRSPPADNKGLNRNNPHGKSMLGKSLRDIPLPMPGQSPMGPGLGQKQQQQQQQQQKDSSAKGNNNRSASSSAKKNSSASSSSSAPIDEWMECFDDKGNVYYFNEKTNESRWEPPEWFEESDPTTGVKYYVHVTMKDNDLEFNSTWTKPARFSRVIRLPA